MCAGWKKIHKMGTGQKSDVKEKQDSVYLYAPEARTRVANFLGLNYTFIFSIQYLFIKFQDVHIHFLSNTALLII